MLAACYRVEYLRNCMYKFTYMFAHNLSKRKIIEMCHIKDLFVLWLLITIQCEMLSYLIFTKNSKMNP